jgi:hypothetical protein
MLKQIRKLCKPAYVYLVLSAITIILMMVQNAGASGTYKVGMYQCPCNNTAGIFLGKAIYVAFWTFILDAVCKAGYKSVSWFLVLFPMILGAVLVGLVLMSGGIREGISTVEQPLPARNNNASRDRLRVEYYRIMEDEKAFNERGNALTRFFQSFFDKLVNFLTGKGFQTERSRQLLEIEKRQENAPKNEFEDQLDDMVANPSNGIKLDKNDRLRHPWSSVTNDHLKFLESRARGEVGVEMPMREFPTIPGLNEAIEKTKQKQQQQDEQDGQIFDVDPANTTKPQMFGKVGNWFKTTPKQVTTHYSETTTHDYDHDK